jgi:DedD protein
MERSLKQRLIGGAALVALAVIFLPMILHGSGKGESLFGGPSVPPKPDWALAPPHGATAPARVTSPVPAPAGPLIVDGPSGAAPESPGPAKPVSAHRKAPGAGTRTPAVDKASQVPERGATGTISSAARNVSPSVTSGRVPSGTSGTASPAPAQHPPAVPGLHAWVVQLASLSRESNAVALRDRLRKAGFTAFVERVRVNGKPVFRVRVGPELDRDRAEALRRRLQQTRNLRGIVLVYP